VRDISIARMVDDRWTAPAPVARDGWRIEGCPVNGPAVAARGSLVAVAWYTEGGAGPAIKVAFSRDAGASFSAPVEVDRARDGRVPVGRVGLSLDGAGDAIVSWVVGGGHILVRRIGADGQAGSIRAVGTTSAKGAIPRVVRVDEWLVVIWTDGSGKDSRLRSSAVALREFGAAAAEPVASEAPSGRPVVGQLVPDYRATSPDGRTVSLRDLRGKPVLINLWATWCAPCLEEMPELIALHEKYAARGVEFIAVSLDDGDAREKVLASFQKRALPFTLWLDPDDLATTVLAAPSLPVTFLVDRDGVIRFRRDGLITAGDRELNAALTGALDAR
jgi:thiol-disulfide isomerase/thioredoxin